MESAQQGDLPMSRSFPYIQRREFTLNFRIAVPGDLQHGLGLTEVTKALRTGDKHVAGPLALSHAANVKRIFTQLRQAVPDMDEDKLRAVMAQAKLKLKLDEQADQHAEELAAERSRHRAEIARVRLEAENEVLRRQLAAQPVGHQAGVEERPRETSRPAAPTFGKVVQAFLTGFQKKKADAMLKKHSVVLPLLLEVVGDKPMTEVRQADLNRFFEIDTYKASVRAFLKVARVQWQDEGFPTTLTTDGAEYVGEREEGEAASLPPGRTRTLVRWPGDDAPRA